MSERYLTYRELCDWLKLSQSSIYRRIKDGTLPEPIRLGHLVRFRASDIMRAVEDLQAAGAKH